MVGERILMSLNPVPIGCLKKIEPEQTILDVGVNIGYYTLNFAQRASKGRVIAFEPCAESWQKLNYNLSLNDFQHIEFHPIALGNFNGQVALEVRDDRNWGMNRIKLNSKEIGDIQLKRLDDFLETLNINKVDVLKVDVEGYEMEFLQGAAQTIRKFKPLLFLKLNDAQLQFYGSSAVEVVAFLGQLGYTDILNADTGKPLSDYRFADCFIDILADF